MSANQLAKTLSSKSVASRFRVGPNDFFEIDTNNSPAITPDDEDEEVIEPYDYTGDYPLESDEDE